MQGFDLGVGKDEGREAVAVGCARCRFDVIDRDILRKSKQSSFLLSLSCD